MIIRHKKRPTLPSHTSTGIFITLWKPFKGLLQLLAQIVFLSDLKVLLVLSESPHLRGKSKNEESTITSFVLMLWEGAGGGSSLKKKTSILSGRLNIVQTDRRELSLHFPLHPHSPVNPVEVIFQWPQKRRSIEEKRKYKKTSTTLLLTNHPVTLRPPFHYPSQVLLLISRFLLRGMKRGRVNQAKVLLFICQRQGNAKRPALWNPPFCLFLG